MSVEMESTRNHLCCAKILKYIGSNRNRVCPTRPPDLKDVEFFEVSPRRVLHVLRPALKSERYYEPPANDRPESINDNFYTRWGRRPHPSGNCRCSFRQSTNSSRLSTHEEVIISQEIQRIRTSLCEAERNGKDIEEIEKSLTLDLTQLGVATSCCETADVDRKSLAGSTKAEVQSRIEPLDEQVKQRIVKDLDRYISDLLDEILSDTIRAIAKADNPFSNREKRETQPSAQQYPPTFDIKFSFHSNEGGDEVGKNDKVYDDTEESGIKGYVNQGFVGSVSDPDTLNFHLRRRLGNDRILENADCIDSGINSVETVELQQAEQEQNLEQSLMDIIDAKLGGSSIGKSLENLGMEIDDTDDSRISKREESVITEVSNKSSQESKATEANEPIDEKRTTQHEKKTSTEKPQENAPSQRSSIAPSERTSKSLDDVIEEPAFNSLRLEFKQSSNSLKEPEAKPRRKVASRFNKTLSMIRRRLVRRLNTPRRKRNTTTTNNNNNNNDFPNKSNKASPSASFKSASTRSQLRPDDLHRRRFPVPPPRRPESIDDEVTLRRRNRKPTIVFLHGFGSSADVFKSQLRYFSDLGYPCIAPDMLGHGFSSAPRRASDYHFDKLLKDLENLLLHYAFRPGQKCVIVAHNYGCSFATALAQKYSSNVHQLVLIAGGGPIPLAPPPTPEGPGHCFFRSCLTPFLVCGMSRGVMYSARGRQHPFSGPEEVPWASTHMRHVLRGMSWPEGDHVFLRRICTPTLLVHGLRDNKVSLVQECQMERTMGKAILEAIPSAGHMPMTDCPDQLNHMIHCFIDLWKNKKW